MNKKNKTILLGLLFVPVGAVLLNACGPQDEMMNSELATDSASDFALAPKANPVLATDLDAGLLDRQYPAMYRTPYIASEYGRCNDAWDNDGDGLTDMHDPDCHILGPLRDLSLYDYPVGHNFDPDVRMIPKGGPGYPGSFRNRAQMTEWFRFLTSPDGFTAGVELMGPGVNNNVVPIPAPLIPKPRQGTAAQGNNNNVLIRDLHGIYLDHEGLLPADLPGKAAAFAPKAGAASTEFGPNFYKDPQRRGIAGGFPGAFYKGGSTGALKSTRYGNPDGGTENTKTRPGSVE